jgi:hypothetical protein
MENESGKTQPSKESIAASLEKYKKQHGITDDGVKKSTPTAINIPSAPPKTNFNPQDFERTMSQETDPDLMMSYEVVQLPSKGKFYAHGISEVNVEYMTSRDEDLLTTPSLIDGGNVITLLLKRKIKTAGIVVDDLLDGDRNAIILFLRTSSYGADYTVQVPDPRTGIPFTTKVDLLQLQYKEVAEQPDEFGHFKVFIPMRKKEVVIRLLTSGEDNILQRKADAIKEAYGQELSDYNTMKLKSHILSIGGNTDRSYIDKFVDVMPALDAYTIRRKIQTVSPDVDMSYEFMAKDGYKFRANLAVGIDFFFPST